MAFTASIFQLNPNLVRDVFILYAFTFYYFLYSYQ
ncbi:unnamed protein product [Haemonchus placei]|uniref:Uncharacterized protein n=1 Tax=Haemonchus placei TaxID=6290 RepID=A0A0N4X222_HAEPC|nr:unnamed protein product [Haemonchus placei]